MIDMAAIVTAISLTLVLLGAGCYATLVVVKKIIQLEAKVTIVDDVQDMYTAHRDVMLEMLSNITSRFISLEKNMNDNFKEIRSESESIEERLAKLEDDQALSYCHVRVKNKVD